MPVHPPNKVAHRGFVYVTNKELSGPWTPAERTSRFALMMRAPRAKILFFTSKYVFLSSIILFFKVTGWQLCCSFILYIIIFFIYFVFLLPVLKKPNIFTLPYLIFCWFAWNTKMLSWATMFLKDILTNTHTIYVCSHPFIIKTIWRFWYVVMDNSILEKLGHFHVIFYSAVQTNNEMKVCFIVIWWYYYKAIMAILRKTMYVLK